MTTIWHLPPETLAHILGIYVDESTHLSRTVSIVSYNNNPSLSRPWLQVTWVCRYWRAVALSTPTLWSTIQIFQRTQVDTIRASLYRSRQVPLNVYLNPYQLTHCGDAVRYLLPSLTRARFLFINLSPYEIESLLSSGQVPSSAPLLESLRVAAQNVNTARGYGARYPPTSLFHNCTLPNLRELSISAPLQLLWSEECLPRSLQRLTINCKMQSAEIPYVIRLISALPLLTYLNLSFNSLAIPSQHHATPTSDYPTPNRPPNLQQLCIASTRDPNAAVQLLENLATTGQTSITLHLRENARNNFQALSPVLSSHLGANAVADNHLHTVQAVSLSCTSVQFFTGKRNANPSESLHNLNDVPSPDLDITFGHVGTYTARSLILELFPDLPLESVSHLTLRGLPLLCPSGSSRGTDFDSTTAWRRLFRTVPNVETLVFTPGREQDQLPEFTAGDFLTTLRCVASTAAAAASNSANNEESRDGLGELALPVPVFPKLKRIVMDGIPFYDDWATENDVSFVDEVISGRRLMVEAGLNVDELEIRNCPMVNENDVTKLRMEESLSVLWDYGKKY
ncbi:hypothetical protein BXZ70DRAFT_697448 [Cristinia sonorae]|uniref:F-box domain-containing protein n=1 Tax=Cristinia sonorae TaxID=1940300 RepID=A0A8K0XK28_9AGAR|nr:hypothetical protein BXZ70DRAFT_697448 [Cristinia sonorae]